MQGSNTLYIKSGVNATIYDPKSNSSEEYNLDPTTHTKHQKQQDKFT